MTFLIGPEALEPDAVVPQCLDNQFISDAVFSDMMARGVDYQDEKVAAARERDFRTEFIRSLIYSSQIVIQRAFFKNSDFLYKNYLPEDGKQREAFASLLKARAIVPFLFGERSLTDNLDFDISIVGDRATKALIETLGEDIPCLRLSPEDNRNAEATAAMATSFGTNLSRLDFMNEQQRNAMSTELFADPSVLQEAGAWKKFNDAVEGLVDCSTQIAREKRRSSPHAQVARTDIYEHLFALDGARTNVSRGRFRSPGEGNPFMFELKKYVDLVYNVNLPDALKRYTFTPHSMPSRMALQDAPGDGFSHEQVSTRLTDPDTIEMIRRSFVARTQTAMGLPLLQDLTVADVVEIRALPEWQVFSAAQAEVLENPLQCLDLVPMFQNRFDEFQRALGAWYNEQRGHQKSIEKYVSLITLGISIGGRLVLAGADPSGMRGMLSEAALVGAESLIPRRVKGYAAKLMVGVYDLEQRRLDADRSYTVELMQTSEELVREEVEQLLHSMAATSADALPTTANGAADQGIQ